MRIVQLPGCWYLDSLPSGEYAGILPLEKQVTTHLGLEPYPADEPLWLVLTNRPVFSYMGQGHQTPRTYEWITGTGWITLPVACGTWPVIYGQTGEPHIAKCAPPTGSQGWRYVAPDGSLVTGDSTIALLHGLLEHTDLSLAQDGSLLVGQGHEDGVRVWADGQERRLHPGACFNIRGKFDPALDLVSVSFYQVASDGLEGWVYWMSLAELKALPVQTPAPLPVVFSFSHPVLVAPFKAEGSGLVDLFTLGNYSEGAYPVLPSGRRLLLGHDSIEDWNFPQDLRQWDIPFLELYRVPQETLTTSVSRWTRQTFALLAHWPGDVGVIPMMYDQFRWSISEILDGLRYLSTLVNLSPRIKVIAPFAYNRANGIVKYPELQQALRDMVKASPGVPNLLPVGGPPHLPPIQSPPEEPMPKSKDQVRADINELIRFYNESDGLNRAARGQSSPVVFNDPAITDWFTLAVMQDVEDIKRQIRAFPEYKTQHPNDPPQ